MRASTQYKNVFSPLERGNLRLKNRIQFSPMVCCLSSAHGEVTREYVDFLGMQAATGAGLVTIGATPVDLDTGVDFYGELNVTEDRYIPGLARIAEEAHRHGAKISIELSHGGRGSAKALLKDGIAWAPSPMPLGHGARHVREMDQRDCDHIILQFARCAGRLKTAGFDMVMIHAAHGNLIGQFLSPYTNHRTDWYGGSLENRMRFPLELLQAVRREVGADFPVEIRVSADEIIEGGIKIDQTIAFLKAAEKYIDLAHISAGLIVDPDYSYYTLPPYYHPFGHNVHYAQQIKSQINTPVTTVGSIKDLRLAEEIIATGKADVVAMARQLLADPDTLKKHYRDLPETVRPCLRCLDGCGKSSQRGVFIRCSVNPAAGRETSLKNHPPAPVKKRVLVAGGGVAGMMAARTLSARGHEVSLFEREGRLGGRLADICSLPFKEDLRQYYRWSVQTTEGCGARICLNTEVTPQLVDRENPDALLIAVGADLITPRIPGIDGDNVVDVVTAEGGGAPAGKNAVVCGGGLSGLECALGLAMEGRQVTVLDMLPRKRFGADLFIVQSKMLRALLARYGVKLMGSRKVERITPEGVWAMDRDWNHYFYPAELVVSAFGLRPRREMVEALSPIIAETCIAGDCHEIAAIHGANHSAFNYALEI